MFQRVSGVFNGLENEGGEKAQLSYRHKANFDQSKSGKYSKNALQVQRIIKAFLVAVNVFINLWVIYNNNKASAGIYNLVMVTVSFYSLWGSTIALIAHLTAW